MPPLLIALKKPGIEKAPVTKAPAQLGESHGEKGRRSMPGWVHSSSGEDNGADRCCGETDKRTEHKEKGLTGWRVEVDEGEMQASCGEHNKEHLRPTF